jgi:hypothetical protein
LHIQRLYEARESVFSRADLHLSRRRGRVEARKLVHKSEAGFFFGGDSFVP